MSAAFKSEVGPTPKLVLLALCDSANDQGECYPSVSTLLEKCSLSERAVQGAIAGLEACGYLRREFRNGRSTVYWMTPDRGNPRSTCTPAVAAPPQDVHPTPARGAPPPPQHVHPTPAARAPITINEPSIEPSGKQKREAPQSVAASVLIEAGLDPETASEFIAHKARMKAPLTARAWADHCAEAGKAGWSPKAAAEKVLAKSWKGFEAKYVANETAPSKPASKQSALEARNAAVVRKLLEQDSAHH